MQKTEFTDEEHIVLGTNMNLIIDTVNTISHVVKRNRDLSKHLINILVELEIIATKMRDKYNE